MKNAICNQGGGLKNKAFTLIELLGVIVIIGIISLIATPIVLNIVESARKNAFKNSAYGIVNSGRYYYNNELLNGGLSEDKMILLEEGKTSELEFSGLSPNGVVSVTADGKVGMAIYNDKWCALKSTYTNEIILIEYEEGKCIIPDAAKDPMLILKGDKEILIKENTEYIDAGVTARTVDGESLNDKVEITISNGVNTVSEIDTSILGTVYTITYTVESNNKTATETRTVTIIDGTAPVITFNPETVELETEEVDSYNIFDGVTIIDNEDGNIEVNSTNVGTEGSLLKIPGTYEITYTVIDKLGNRVSRIRTFIVKDLTKPEITINPNEQSTYVQSKTIIVTATDNIKLSALSYVLIKDGVRDSSTTINTGDTITLNTTGSYQIEVTAIDESNNSNTVTSGTYLIDTTKPTITVPSSTIVKANEAISYDLMTGVTYSDNTGINPTITTSGNLSATPDDYTIIYTVTDTAGNTETVSRTITVVEAEGPILNFSNAGSDSWTKAQTITVTATDNSSLSSFTYEVFKDGTSQGIKTVSVSGKSATSSVPLSESGIYTIKLTASDEYGTSNTITSGTYKIDETAPSYNVTGNPTSWAKSATLTISSPSDGSGSGLHATPYSFDNGSTWSATATYSVTANGTVNVVVRDALGNQTKKSISVTKIDTAGPTYSVTGNPTSWAKSATLTISSPSDGSGSGLHATPYSFDNGSTWSATATYQVTSNGTVNVVVRDALGNQTKKSISVTKIDTTGPTYNTSVSNASSWTTSKTITISSASDASAGLHTTPYSFDGGSTWSATATKSVTTEGTYNVVVRDAVGNATTKSVSVSKIDTAAPTITRTTSSYTTTKGTSYAVTNLYTVTYGSSGGSTTCKVGTTTVTNLSSLAVGSHTLTCTATSGAGKTASVSISITINKPFICKRATLLHTETCTENDSTYYCSGAGYAIGAKITYGNLGTGTTLTSGDAFDCDVNGDGTYDSATERFYYVSDLYNTTTKAFDNNYAVLVYYNNTTSGVADNTSASLVVYDSSNKNYQGPVTAITNLPTTTQWSNVSLASPTRAILTQKGTTSTSDGAKTYNLPTAFDYSSYAARLLTAQEINSACGITVRSMIKGELDTCNYLMENTNYSGSSLVADGYWLETPYASDTYGAWYVRGLNRYVGNTYASSSGYGARPAIEILKSDISM